MRKEEEVVCEFTRAVITYLLHIALLLLATSTTQWKKERDPFIRGKCFCMPVVKL